MRAVRQCVLGLIGVVVALCVLSACTGGPAPPSLPGAEGGPQVPLGVFRGASPQDVDGFVRWFGHRPDLVVTFADGYQDWAALIGTGRITPWRGSPYRLVYSVPMLPGQVPGVSMAKGAVGEYDEYFAQLGENLVAAGQQDSILRIGWEFNIRSSPWHTSDPAEFVAFWRRIVRVMRNVEGQQFRFDWNPLSGEFTDDNAVDYFPGGEFVDYVGVDVYDVSWDDTGDPIPPSCADRCATERRAANWHHILTSKHGLQFWSDFAGRENKPLSVPEWGAWDRLDGRGGGDNPDFVHEMHAFITDPANHVAYQSYFDFDNAGVGTHRLVDLPQVGAAYRREFGPDYP